MLSRVLNTPMNTTPKYSLNNYWWALESIEIKGCIGTKRVMPCLNINVFISLSFLFDFWFFKQEDFFFQNFLSFELIGISIVKNKCCVILASTLNRVSVLLEMLSQYLATVIIRGAFWTQSSICDAAFCKNR